MATAQTLDRGARGQAVLILLVWCAEIVHFIVQYEACMATAQTLDRNMIWQWAYRVWSFIGLFNISLHGNSTDTGQKCYQAVGTQSMISVSVLRVHSLTRLEGSVPGHRMLTQPIEAMH